MERARANSLRILPLCSRRGGTARHLTILMWLDVASLVLLTLAGLATGATVVATAGAMPAIDERAMAAMAPMTLFTGLSLLLVLMMAWF